MKDHDAHCYCKHSVLCIHVQCRLGLRLSLGNISHKLARYYMIPFVRNEETAGFESFIHVVIALRTRVEKSAYILKCMQ